jgi:hypothetical protein
MRPCLDRTFPCYVAGRDLGSLKAAPWTGVVGKMCFAWLMVIGSWAAQCGRTVHGYDAAAVLLVVSGSGGMF